jgi:rRNA maturation RNase YbeY
VRDVLVLRNRQRVCQVELRVLRRIVKRTLEEVSGQERFNLGIYLVGTREIIWLNEGFLGHRGPTDVITFDYSERAEQGFSASPPVRHGEIFVCMDEAVSQARRFRTTWQHELVRYVVHGILHLRGFEDSRASQRRKMKRKEDSLLRELAREFRFSKLQKV